MLGERYYIPSVCVCFRIETEKKNYWTEIVMTWYEDWLLKNL